MSTTADQFDDPYTICMVDAWSLRILVEVADRGSLSAAAKELVLSQPAVSRQIAALERRLKVPLFRRVPRGVVPTEAGATAVDLARGILSRLDAFDATMQALAGLGTGPLRLAGFASVNTWFLPEAIRRFRAAHPDVTVTLERVDPLGVIEAVRRGAVDVALLTDWQLVADPDTARTDAEPALLDPDRLDIELVPLLDEQLHVALPVAHPLARRRVVPLANLRAERWIDGAYPDCLGPLRELGEALGAPPQVDFHCDDWNGKQALVAAGVGVMVVPRLACAAMRPELVVRPTKPALPTRRLYAGIARPPYRSAAASAMLELLPEIAASLRTPLGESA
jgi:DNA-binding transcriptional LysR family regulator